MAAETDETQVPQTIGVSPDEMEQRPIVAPGRYEDCRLEQLELKIRQRDGQEDQLVASMRFLVRDEEVGTISVFHDEPVGPKTNSRFPRWMEALGFDRAGLADTPVPEIAKEIGVPGRKVGLELSLMEAGEFTRPNGEVVEYAARNKVKDLWSL